MAYHGCTKVSVQAARQASRLAYQPFSETVTVRSPANEHDDSGSWSGVAMARDLPLDLPLDTTYAYCLLGLLSFGTQGLWGFLDFWILGSLDASSGPLDGLSWVPLPTKTGLDGAWKRFMMLRG